MAGIFTFDPSPPKPSSPFVENPEGATPSRTPSLEDDVPGHLKSSVNSGRVRGSLVYSGGPQRDGSGKGEGPVQKLASEPQMGSTEYKLSLVRGEKSKTRMEQLTTQLQWRLQQSSSFHASSLPSKSPGAISSLLQDSKGAIYIIGVADDGTMVGLDEEELEGSLDVLREMASKLEATVTITQKKYVRTVSQDEVDRAKEKIATHINARPRAKKSKGKKDKDSKDTSDCASEDLEADLEAADKFRIPVLNSKLFVVEALVKPGYGSLSTALPGYPPAEKATTVQLRVSLTGSTRSGKSTLLGTLINGELDNGMGKNRLSLLKHRHEVKSGITSSVASEIIGYRLPASSPGAWEKNADNDKPPPEDQPAHERVVNYASGIVSSWNDIHSVAEGGRIVFMTDSAGELKYSRSTFRSLIGWAPHYVALVISTKDLEEHKELSGEGDSMLSQATQAHMDLCIKLGLRMLVIFTKRDIGVKQALYKCHRRMLDTLKASRRRPFNVTSIKTARDAVKALEEDRFVVPTVFTSSVTGAGINELHELLMSLPIPTPPEAPGLEDAIRPPPDTTLTGVTEGISNLAIAAHGSEVEVRDETDSDPATGDPQLITLFHVEQTFDLKPTDMGIVVGGHVKYGRISVGDKLLAGPFPVGEVRSRSRSATPTPTATPPAQTFMSNSFPQKCSLDGGDEGRGRTHSRGTKYDEEAEWRTVQVVSIRSLRLPVTTLFPGEAGTIGIISVDEPATTISSTGADPGSETLSPFAASHSAPIGSISPASERKTVTFASQPEHKQDLSLRKGIAILNPSNKADSSIWPVGYTAFTAVLEEDKAVQSVIKGSDWIVHIASVRVVARVLFVDPPPPVWGAVSTSQAEEEVFEFEEGSHGTLGTKDVFPDSNGPRKYGFVMQSVEWMELGAQVLITRASEKGLAGQEIFVGRVVQRIRDL